ncbi:MAG: hypothetical protein PVJ51_03095 [Acidobacteriota bacterium]|jgi:hypothetical protein
MGDKNHFAIDMSFDVSTSDAPPDGLYYLMQWGMCYQAGDDGTWTQIAASDRHDGDYGYGSVTIDIDTGDTMTFSVFSATDEGESEGDLVSVDWLRCCFRPAHSVAPDDAKVKTTPFNSDKTNDLLKGVDISGATVTNGPVTSVGLDEQFAFAYIGLETPDLKEVPGSGDDFAYEFTAYLAVTVVGADGNEPMYFKTDPELITGKRGG